jgi:hypothetical protein
MPEIGVPLPDALDRARHVIEERLHELEDEAKKLRDALARLAHQDGRKPARRASKRAPRGTRQSPLLASIEKHPEYKSSEHATAMKVSPNQVYGLARKLQDEGTITKTAKGTYKAKKATANAS